MRVNQENKSVDMEVRDINYILPAYVRSYLFYSKNEMPEKIVFPMFPSVSVQGKEIPIEYVPPLDPVAVEIAEDGAGVAEVTPEQEEVLDEKDEEIKRLKGELAELKPLGGEDGMGGTEAEATTSEQLLDEAADLELDEDTAPEVSPAKAAFAEATKDDQPEPEQANTPLEVDRIPKQPPGGDIGPGLGLSDMQARDSRDQVRTARDLVEEPDINEAEEKDYEKPISRDEEGKPVVENKNE